MFRNRLRTHSFASVFLIVLLSNGTATRFDDGVAPKDEAAVWAISSSKVYHCPGSRWYGKTAEGKYISECQALREGFRAAFGRGCGAECMYGMNAGMASACTGTGSFPFELTGRYHERSQLF